MALRDYLVMGDKLVVGWDHLKRGQKRVQLKRLVENRIFVEGEMIRIAFQRVASHPL
ncbi:hypothetical protein DSL72_007197 [Monilinia vaccinii-corymbosi]|uniref:Uncharacterized protein n=1 Tax=Monilinia vaccinii-corymbosi TaxID=61207 RepID=A0A8A3PM47_9HELO|nr:hypothetical protein DSL72_007197 [Monilinia vaccinii-corymbosi]